MFDQPIYHHYHPLWSFNSICHSNQLQTLLFILMSLGIQGLAWQWPASYVNGRSYQAKWKGFSSVSQWLSTGISQGLVFGPLLFFHYTRSLCEISKHGFSYYCYADTTQLNLLRLFLFSALIFKCPYNKQTFSQDLLVIYIQANRKWYS